MASAWLERSIAAANDMQDERKGPPEAMPVLPLLLLVYNIHILTEKLIWPSMLCVTLYRRNTDPDPDPVSHSPSDR